MFRENCFDFVIPAKAGIHREKTGFQVKPGMTALETVSPCHLAVAENWYVQLFLLLVEDLSLKCRGGDDEQSCR